MKKIELKKFTDNYLKTIWEIGYVEDEPEWINWDGPYFEDYTDYKSFEDFVASDEYSF